MKEKNRPNRKFRTVETKNEEQIKKKYQIPYTFKRVCACVCVLVRHAKLLQKSLKFKKQTAATARQVGEKYWKIQQAERRLQLPFSPFSVCHFPFPRAPLIIRFALTLRFPRNFSFLFSFLTKNVNNWHCYARDGDGEEAGCSGLGALPLLWLCLWLWRLTLHELFRKLRSPMRPNLARRPLTDFNLGTLKLITVHFILFLPWFLPEYFQLPLRFRIYIFSALHRAAIFAIFLFISSTATTIECFDDLSTICVFSVFWSDVFEV